MSSAKYGVVRNENNERREKNFVGYIQTFSDKTATKYKSSALGV